MVGKGRATLVGGLATTATFARLRNLARQAQARRSCLVIFPGRVAAETKNFGGNVGVCGAWTKTKRISAYMKSAGAIRTLLNRGLVILGNRTLVRNPTFMRQVPEEDFVFGTTVPCKIIGLKWHDTFMKKKLRIHTPRLTVVG